MFSNMRHIRAFMSACKASHPAFSLGNICVLIIFEMGDMVSYISSLLSDFEILSLKSKVRWWGPGVKWLWFRHKMDSHFKAVTKKRQVPSFSMTWAAGQTSERFRETFLHLIVIRGRGGLALAGWLSALPGVATGQNLRLISKFITTFSNSRPDIWNHPTACSSLSLSAVGCVVLEMLAVPSRGVLVPFPGQPG